MANNYFLERPRNRARLIRLLAAGAQTTVCARIMGVTPGAVSSFKVRHKAELDAMLQGMREATDHLWIAHKANRVAALDTAYADLQDFKEKRMEDQRVPAQIEHLEPMEIGDAVIPLQPRVIPARDRDQTHGYEAVDYKWIGGEWGREVEVRKFDAALFNAELKVLQQAAEELGDIPREPQVTLQQQNNTVNYFDRSSVLAYRRQQQLQQQNNPPPEQER